MGWLDAQSVLPLAGYRMDVRSGDEALLCAEQLIEQATGIKWGGDVEFTTRVNLVGRSVWLPLPRDALTVTTITPAIASGRATEISPNGLELLEDGLNVFWGAGQYRVEGTRGITNIPGAVIKAASLIVAWYLGLSDPERSRYRTISIGDFSGDMRLGFPVPEAYALLTPWMDRVGVNG